MLLLSPKGRLSPPPLPLPGTGRWVSWGPAGLLVQAREGFYSSARAADGHGLGVCFIQQKGCVTLEQSRDVFKELRSSYA